MFDRNDSIGRLALPSVQDNEKDGAALYFRLVATVALPGEAGSPA